ncbi:MAG: ATP-binding protein, partial [Firmicutes bacterium]|nr:ATP-binding protein [Bacillota bacterium]
VDYLITSGTDPRTILSISLDNARNSQYRTSEKLYAYFAEKIKEIGKHCIILIDEVQLCEHFEFAINGLKEDFEADIYVTGSNSEFLSKDISTVFRGRSTEIKVFPLSFEEFMNHVPGDYETLFKEYIMYGGMPNLLELASSAERDNYLSNLMDTVLLRDIVDRHHLRNVNLFYALVDFLLSNIGSYVSANNIANYFRSNGYKNVDSDTIGSYLEYLCDAFLFYKVQRYDIKGKEYLKTLNKYYVCDLGLRNVRMNYRQMEQTHMLENLIYLDLLRRGYVVDIGKNNDKEIDFVVRKAERLWYIQVAYTLSGEGKLEQEIKPFEKIDDGFIKEAINTGKSKEMSNHKLLVTKNKGNIPAAASAAPLIDEEGRVFSEIRCLSPSLL